MNELEKRINDLEKKLFIMNCIKYFFVICAVICALVSVYFSFESLKWILTEY